MSLPTGSYPVHTSYYIIILRLIFHRELAYRQAGWVAPKGHNGIITSKTTNR